MVQIVGYSVRVSQKGEEFIALELQGDLIVQQSKESGRHYVTAKRVSLASTFDEETARNMLGKEMPGRIEKVPCEDYEYTVEETGEKIILSYRWDFVPEREPAASKLVPLKKAA